jgi:hypothetical protein
MSHLFLDLLAIDGVLSSLFELFGFDFQIRFVKFEILVVKFGFGVVEIEFIFSKVLRSKVISFSLLKADFFAFFPHFCY